MHWMFTGVLIAVSAGTAGYTLWLVRRLFTTVPVGPPGESSVGTADPVEQKAAVVEGGAS